MGQLDAYAEEGVPDEVEREAVAGDEEEGELGVPGRQRRLLHLGLGLHHRPPSRSPGGLLLLLLRHHPRSPFLAGGALLLGGVLQQEGQEADQEEAEHQQERQQRRRALGPAVGEPPRLHPDSNKGRTGLAWPTAPLPLAASAT
jgi:hypothetical protein